MKLHLPLSLRSALLACLALFPVAYASTYVATGVNVDNVSASNRFYDSGQGVYWLEAGAQPFVGAGVLHTQTGSTEFLGTLNNYIPEGTDTSHVHSDLFAGLTADDKTSWYHATANVIQYWQSYYGVFAQNAATMPYGYTYDPANQQLLGGTQSLNVGMYFYDNWTNAGGDFAMAARWYLTNDHTYTNVDEETLSKLKVPGTEAGYFAPYFASGKDPVVVQDAYSQESLDAAIVDAFGLSAVEGKENTYTQSTPGQIAFIGISCEEASTALTCYGFKTDEKGNVSSLMLAASDDAAYQMIEVYVKEVIDDDGSSSVRLYKDAACTELWERGGKGNWYLDAVSYIDTPEVLVNMYNEYNDSDLTWTGGSSIWKQEADDKSLYTLPDSTSGWTAHAGSGTEFAGEYAAYFTEGRNVIFTSTGAGTIELVGDIEPSSVTVNNALGADYIFTGEGKLTGITRLTKQGEGTLTISTANNYSGGTRLEGGTLIAGNSSAFGSAGLELINGTLDFNGNTIGNTIYVSEGAVVTAKNGTSTGDFVLTNASSYTADNFRIKADSISLIGNKETTTARFINLTLTDGSSVDFRGGQLSASTINVSSLKEVVFRDAAVTKTSGSWLRGGVVGGNNVTFTDNGKVAVLNNTTRHNSIIYGGAVYAGNLLFERNAEIVIADNYAETSLCSGGAVQAYTIRMNDNGSIRISENIGQSRGNGADGGALNANNIYFSGNAELEIISNKAKSQSNEALGGALYGNVTIQGNGIVEMTGNGAESKISALGGAIYAEGGVRIVNNESVTLRNNYELTGRDYRLRSIYAGGNLELSANVGQNIEVYDSVYTVGNLTLNANKAGGEILLSGEHTETDLLDAKNGVAGTVAEITNSRTNTVVGTTTLGGGTLSLEHGAILQTGGFAATAGSRAVVNLNHGIINSSGHAVTFATGTGIHAEGVSSLIKAEALQMQDGSYVSFTLNTVNKEQAILSFFDPWQIEGNMTVNIGFANDAREDYYILMDVGAYGSMPENWSENHISVSGAEYSQLVWQDGYLYLNWTGGEIPFIQPYIWQGAESNVWDNTTLNWLHDGHAVAYKDNVMVEFRGAAAGDVELVGDCAARSVLVNSDADYTFKGEGKLTGTMRLTKQGEGTLTISTANDYSGGTRLEGGTLIAGNSSAFGSAGLELINGTLDFNGNTIGNTIYVSEGAVVTAKNGTSTGDFVLTNASSYTADNFRIKADSISLIGNKETTTARFINLTLTDGSSVDFRGGQLSASTINVSSLKEVVFRDAAVTKTSGSWLRGGVVGGNNVTFTDNGKVAVLNNTTRHNSIIYGGAVYAGNLLFERNAEIVIADNYAETSLCSGGAVQAYTIRMNDNGSIRISENIGQSRGNGADGGALNANNIYFSGNAELEIISNKAKSQSNEALGGALYGNVTIQGNGIVEMTGNGAESKISALGGAIYAEGGVRIVNNESVTLRNNYELTGRDYRLRSIYAGGNLELSANVGQNIEVYDSVYTVGNLTLNANKAGGEILLSGEHTETDLLDAKNGVAGTVAEITNSRTNTVVGTTTLGGGTLSLEHGAILQTGGFTATAGSDAMVRMDNAVLNSSGYDVRFGSGTGLVVGGSNTLTASNFTMQEGSYLSFDLREKNQNLSALSVNANMALNGLDVVVMNADIMAAGKYKLVALAEGSQYDVGSWETAVNSVTGVDSASLSWENGTLYYTSTNEWIISVTEDATIIEDTTGKDIVIGNGAELVLNACRQGHPNCDNPKHGGRPGNPGQGHAKPKPGNSGNNGNGNGNNKDHDDGDGSLVIVEGSAYIKDRGEFEGLLSFRGSAEEERHFYTEKDLGVAYIAVFTDADATSHLHVVQGKKLETEGIVGDGNLEKHGAGSLVLEGYDADESSTEYFGCLGVNEGAVRVADNSQAYIANTAVNGESSAAAMQVGRGATMTGERLTVSGENATLHNDGSIAMSEGITVDGGTVKGSGTFSGLSMNGGSLVVGNSPGLQTYQGALELKATDVVFSVAGYEQAADATTSGWNVGVYSTIDMGGNSLTLTGETTLTIAFGADALGSLMNSTSAEPLSFSLTLFQNVGNVGFFDESMLALMLEQTRFIITTEVEGLPAWAAELKGADVSDYVVSESSYYAVSGSNVVFVGSIAANGSLIPEPATTTLSLLALAALAARRRRKND